MSLLLTLCAGLLFSAGTYLLLQRRLSRIIIGLGLLSHGANLLMVTASGRRGGAVFIGAEGDPPFADPLPQALALTAIVISFGVTAFLLALAFRSWILSGDDEVEDDVEDALIRRQRALDEEVADEEVALAARVAAEADIEGRP